MKRQIAVLVFLATSASSALADHHLVKRALQEARCLPTSVTELANGGGTLVYEGTMRKCGAPRRRDQDPVVWLHDAAPEATLVRG